MSKILLPAILIAVIACSAQPKQTKQPVEVAPAKAKATKPPKVTDCFKVDSMVNATEQLGGPIFEVMAHSECPMEIPEVWVIVKHYDRDDYRIGWDVWGTKRLTPGEKAKHRFDAHISYGTKLDHVKVMEITTDWEKAKEWGHPRNPSTSLTIDNFSGTVRNFKR